MMLTRVLKKLSFVLGVLPPRPTKVSGAKKLHLLEDVSGALRASEGDTKVMAVLGALLGELQKVDDEAPRATEVCNMCAILMGVDLHRSCSNGSVPVNEIPTKIANYFKFCNGELRVAKKDLAKTLTDKLDKVLKDFHTVHSVAVSYSVR